jgi:cytochrome c-type biogenesis protein CcmE
LGLYLGSLRNNTCSNIRDIGDQSFGDAHGRASLTTHGNAELKPKQQRLLLGVVAVAALVGAGFIALSALESKAAYFYTPSDIRQNAVAVGKPIRLGGMVADQSIKRGMDGVTVRFIVVDENSQIPVFFKGITPDLFKEKSGVIAEGSMARSGEFIATNLLAKHDEKYMPPELSKSLSKPGASKQ